MHLAVRARRTLARHPSIYWICCCSLAIAAGLLVRQQLAQVDEARLRWGATRDVLVASIDHAPGRPLQARTVAMPVAVIPPGAIDAAGGADADDAGGAEVAGGDDVDAGVGTVIARQRIGIGEIVVVTDVTSMSGPAALAPPGSVVVGITDPLARNASIGLDVAVVSDGIVLASNASVVDLADDVILVSVDEADAPMVAAAARNSTASILFLP